MHIINTLKEVKILFTLLLSQPHSGKDYTKDLRLVFDMVNIEMEKLQGNKDMYQRSRQILEDKDPEIFNLFKEYQDGRHELLDNSQLTLEKLSNMPSGSLGKFYAEFLIKNNMSPSPIMANSVEDTDFLDFYRTRTLIFHDFIHVLCGLEVDMFGEFGTNGVYVSQVFNPATYILMGTYIIKCFRKTNEKAIETIVAGFVAGYNCGKAAKPFGSFVWEDYLTHPIEEVREVLNVKKIDYNPSKYLNFQNI